MRSVTKRRRRGRCSSTGSPDPIMVEASDLWPPFGLVIRAGDLRLTPIADDDLPALVELVLAGIHDPDWMPFDTPWTLAPPTELPRRYAQHYWEVRAGFRPDD